MAFATTHLDDPQNVGAGERYGVVNTILSTNEFEDGLRVGRFAKWDTGQLDNMDGSATPTIAGVVLRNVANPVEDAATVDADLQTNTEYIRSGLVSVRVKAGETPARFGRVYASNAGDANDGMATATNTDVVTNAEFIEEIQTGVWLIYVTPAPGDVATHIGDATGAHAASAISVADAGGFTAADDVEEALAEMYPAVQYVAAIADPGDAGAIPVLRSGNCAITTGAVGETRTLAAPGTPGLTLVLTHDVDGGGAAVITVASAIDQTGNNTITLADAGDLLVLMSAEVAGTPVWRVVANDGAALSIV
jgi:hypothetical protein